MAYQIDLFNGDFLVNIDDQTINTTATDLRLVGRNYAGYGEIQNENFVHLLENFASSTAPPRSLTGQIWYDSSTKKLKFFDGAKYKTTSGAEVSETPPPGLSSGEFWFDSVEEQLYTWSGTEYILVGPERTPTVGDTAAIPRVIKDVLGADRSILQLVSGNRVIAIICDDEFTINNTINPIAGFFNIRPGINLVNIDADGIATTSNHRLWGTATNALRLNGLTSADFLRSSNTEFKTQVKFLDSGFTLGDQNDLRIRIANGNEPIFENTIGGSLLFRITTGIESRDIAIIQQDGVFPGSNEQFKLGKPGIRWKEIHSEEITANKFYGTFVGTIESPAPGSPGGPPIGQPVPPLTLQSGLSVAGDLAMDTGNLNIILPEGNTVDVRSGDKGIIDNVDVNPFNAGSGNFTNISVSQNSIISATNQSTSVSTGALIISGGLGVAKNLNVGGDGAFTGSGSLRVPVGDTSQRPSSAVIGMIRFNTDIENFEGFDGENWREIGLAASEDFGEITGSVALSLDYRFVNEEVNSFADYGSLF